jgi:hypothetical protein
MRFIVQAEAFARLVELAGDEGAANAQPKALVRVVVCGGKLCVQVHESVAEMEAEVQEEGECWLQRQALLMELNSQPLDTQLTVHAGASELLLGDRAIPVTEFRAQAALPLRFRVFLATDLGAVASNDVLVNVGRLELREPA